MRLYPLLSHTYTRYVYNVGTEDWSSEDLKDLLYFLIKVICTCSIAAMSWHSFSAMLLFKTHVFKPIFCIEQRMIIKLECNQILLLFQIFLVVISYESNEICWITVGPCQSVSYATLILIRVSFPAGLLNISPFYCTIAYHNVKVWRLVHRSKLWPQTLTDKVFYLRRKPVHSMPGNKMKSTAEREIEEIQRLKQQHRRRLEENNKTLRRALAGPARPPSPAKFEKKSKGRNQSRRLSWCCQLCCNEQPAVLHVSGT